MAKPDSPITRAPLLNERMVLEAQACEESLAMFMRKGWRWADESQEFMSNWHIDCISDHLTAAIDRQITGPLIFTLPPRHMKLCADSTPIATPAGYRKHGDIQPGDYVFGPDGKPALVRGVSLKGDADLEVVFGNGDIIKVNGNHLWTVFDRWQQKWRTLDTKTIASMPMDKNRNRFFIPEFECLNFDGHHELPLHPYLLGCWLGDGTSASACIAHDRGDIEHIEKIGRLGYNISAVYKNGGNGVRSALAGDGVYVCLGELGVRGNKHIPDIYATASVDDRMELLAGLIDTDGHVEKVTNRVRISTCDKEFAAQTERLALSLGFRAYTLVAKTPGYGAYKSGHEFVYQVGFQPDRPIPTALPRKAITRTDFTKRRRAIVEIRRAQVAEIGHCLNVDREDGLYLVGRTNIVTHNSIGINVFMPAWSWAQPVPIERRRKGLSVQEDAWRGPGVRFAFISYDQELSNRDSVKCQSLIESPWYQQRWGDRFKLRHARIEKFTNSTGGLRQALSFSGKLTGFGADIIGIDDAHNVQSDSPELDREKVINAWKDALQSRLDNRGKGSIFIIGMQRSNESDLVGYMLAHDFGGLHVCLPAEYERKHPYVFVKNPAPRQQVIRQSDTSRGADIGPRIGEVWEDRRKEGELLWPSRFPLEVLRDLTKDMTSHGAAGQYQQRPAAREGGMLKRAWFNNPVKLYPQQKLELVRSWDKAATESTKDDPDYTVGVLMGRDPVTEVFYVLDVIRGRFGPADLEKKIYSTAVLDGQEVRIRIPQEPAAAGKFQAFHFVGLLQGYNVFVEREGSKNARGNKEMRAEPFAAQCEHGFVKLVEAKWNEMFIDELATFPNGNHDDQVDAVCAAFRALSRRVTYTALAA